MSRYYYAQGFAYENAASLSDTLYRFATAAERLAWCRENWAHRDVITRDEARRWYPAAFRDDTPQNFKQSFLDANGWYWDDADANGACEWLGSPTGGVYAEL